MRIFFLAFFLLSFSACNPLGGTKSKVDTDHKPGHSSAGNTVLAPVLSYTGATETNGLRARAMTVTPTTLTPSGAISNCTITAGGSLPTGLSINANTCVISGTPITLLSSTSFTVTATNSSSQTTTATVLLSVSENYIDNDGSTFGEGISNGVIWDATNSYLRLNTATNNAELDASWTPQWSSLVSYWKMDNSWAATVGSTSFTAINGASFSSSPKIGTHTSDFDGVNDYASASVDLNLDENMQYTIAFWFNPEEYAGDYLFSLVGEIGYLEFYSQSGTYFCVIQDDGDYTNCFQIPALNQWYHLAVTYSSAMEIRIYLNNVEVAWESVGISLNPGPSTVNLGRSFGGGNYFEGKIDDLAIWNKQLTSAEIQTLFSRQSAKYSGQITSRVMDSSSPIAWDGLKWLTTLPFGKELTGDANNSGTITSSDSETSINYSSLVGSTGSVSDNNLMSGLIALFHLDSVVEDLSKLNFSLQGDAAVSTNAILGLRSMSFDGVGDFLEQPSSTPDLGVLTGVPFSFSAWIYLKSWAAAGNPNYETSSIIGKHASDNHYSFQVQNKRVSFSHGSTFYSSNILSDSYLGRWVHVALITESNNNMTFYVDGIAHGSASFSGTFDQPSVPMMIGATRNDSGNYNSFFNGNIDEIAIWSRALHVNELKQLYRRGANRIKFQVKSCIDIACNCSSYGGGGSSADCDGDTIANASDTSDANKSTWIGNDNTNGSYFSELHNYAPYNYDVNNCSATNLILTSSPSLLFNCFSAALTSINGTNHQYFQYRSILESDDVSPNCNYGSGATWCSPELKSVEIKP
jgi:hypothetical protein